jgi:hypothetical protein
LGTVPSWDGTRSKISRAGPVVWTGSTGAMRFMFFFVAVVFVEGAPREGGGEE